MPHQRRKSGHSSGNNSSTDVRRPNAVTVTDLSRYKRPAMTRRHTPGSSQKLGRSHRDQRDREWHESLYDERESFPQYCMTCEKQFVTHDERYLYCSDACRRVDQNSTSHSTPSQSQSSNYPFYAAGVPEPRDIIPRASPSRPGSMHFSSSPPATPGSSAAYPHHTSAISALRSLNVRPPSPPSPTSGTSTIWPFSRSAATSPSTSLVRPTSGFFSSTYDAGYGGGAYTYDMGPGGMDRPLPSRHPGGYSRPKSIELVTPMVGR